jgi:hypothetical protein
MAARLGIACPAEVSAVGDAEVLTQKTPHARNHRSKTGIRTRATLKVPTTVGLITRSVGGLHKIRDGVLLAACLDPIGDLV